MKAKLFIFSALALLLAASCQKETVNNHDDLRQPKKLELTSETINVGWQKDTVTLSFKSNCYWGFDFLNWTSQVVAEGDTTQVMTSAKWMSTPVIYGQGDATVDVVIDANARSNRPREGFIKVFTGDKDVYKIIAVNQAGNPDWVPAGPAEPIELTFDFTPNSAANFSGWPTASQSVGEYVYSLDGQDYSFYLGRCNIGNYLVIYNAGAYLGLPVVKGYKLTRVTAVTSSNNSKARGALVSADEAGTVVVGADTAWPASPNAPVVYELEGTDYDTRYYLMCTVLGLPTASVILYYEP